MQTVYLEGNLAKFGHKWETSCGTIAEVLRLIECQTPEFRKHLIAAHEAGIEYQIQRGKELVDIEECFLTLKDEDIVITEVPAGSKGVGKILAAIAIIVVIGLTGPAGFFANIGTALTMSGTGFAGFAASAAALLAVNLAVMGIAEMMLPNASMDGMEENKNYLFSGPANTVTQGQAVPLAYGELIVGGAPIALAFSRTPIVLDGGEVGGTVGTSPVLKETVNLIAGDTNNTEGTPGTNPPRRDPIMDFTADDEAFNILEYIGHIGL